MLSIEEIDSVLASVSKEMSNRGEEVPLRFLEGEAREAVVRQQRDDRTARAERRGAAVPQLSAATVQAMQEVCCHAAARSRG